MFYSDQEVANLIGMSASTIRGQRHKRKHSLDHWFQIDPIYIGKMPKYKRSEVEELIEGFEMLRGLVPS